MEEALDTSNMPDMEEEQEGPDQNRANLAVEDFKRRQLEKAKAEAVKKAKQLAEKQAAKLAQKGATKLGLRILAGASTISVVGILAAYLQLTFQLIVGNLMRHESIELSPWEVGEWAILTALIIIIFCLLVLVIGMVITVALGAKEAAGVLGDELFNVLKNNIF